MTYGICIYGVPGSGKTTKCLEMLDTFLEEYDPNEIAYLSFTRAATNEAIKRAVAKFGFERREMEWFRTIHSACFKLLELSLDSVLKEDEIKKFCKMYGLRYKTEGERAIDDERSILRPTKHPEVEGNCLIDFSNRLRNITGKNASELSEEEVMRHWARTPSGFSAFLSPVRIYEFLIEYEDYKERIGKFDYTDMLINVLKEGAKPPIRILINDEAQDNTPLQGKIIDLWCEDVDKYILSADDDQVLFEWSGCTAEWFLKHDYEYEIILSESHRVPHNIMLIASAIVRKNKMRKEKNAVGKKEQGVIRILNRPSLEELIALGLGAEKSYFLFRANYLEDRFCKQLLNAGIPFGRLLRATPWTKKILNIHNAIAKFGMGKKASGEEVRDLLEKIPSQPYLRRGAKALFKKQYMLDAEYTASDIQKIAISYTHLDLSDKKSVLNALNLGKNDVRREALTKARPYPSEKLKIYTGTVHSSKGLEAENVFVFLDYPKHIRKITEEERRILYVAITRGKKRVFLIKNYFSSYCLLWSEIVEAWQEAKRGMLAVHTPNQNI
ncbi:MAG: UvrD-helicase domain-containing protein [Candidatus Baldrarchaeia archaeon]